VPITKLELELEEKEMKPEAKKQWVQALNRKSYRRNDSSIWLHTKSNNVSKYSALGVLTDLWAKDIGYGWSHIMEHHYDEDIEDKDITYVGLSSTKQVALDNEIKGLLSPAVMKWAGLDDPQATLDNGNSIFSLDQEGVKFILVQPAT